MISKTRLRIWGIDVRNISVLWRKLRKNIPLPMHHYKKRSESFLKYVISHEFVYVFWISLSFLLNPSPFFCLSSFAGFVVLLYLLWFSFYLCASFRGPSIGFTWFRTKNPPTGRAAFQGCLDMSIITYLWMLRLENFTFLHISWLLGPSPPPFFPPDILSSIFSLILLPCIFNRLQLLRLQLLRVMWEKRDMNFSMLLEPYGIRVLRLFLKFRNFLLHPLRMLRRLRRL